MCNFMSSLLSKRQTLPVSPNDEFYTWKPKNFLQRVYSLLTLNLNDSSMIGNVRRWVEIKDVNTKTKMTYGELLAKVWILIKNHPQK
jgi:hypothetical protein